MIHVIALLIGLAILIYGADLLVKGSSTLASRFGIPPILIGLTVVAFGTSLPEFMVSLLSAWRGSTDIAISNIVGSNIANILLILGVSALLYPLQVSKATVWKEIPFSILAAVVLFVVSFDAVFDKRAESVLSRTDGLVLLSFFAIFLYYTYEISRSSQDQGNDDVVKDGTGIAKIVGFILLGLLGVVAGGQLAVDNAVWLAQFFGISERVIGLTIIAVGTSLPELATSAVAAYRKQPDLAIGNIVGSNIFNIFWILGASALIAPLAVSSQSIADTLLMITTSFILFFSMFIGKKKILERWQGILFLVLYVGYLVVSLSV